MGNQSAECDKWEILTHGSFFGRRVLRVKEPREIGMAPVLHQVRLAARVQGENLGPDEHQNLPQIRRGGLQKLFSESNKNLSVGRDVYIRDWYEGLGRVYCTP